MTQNPFGFGAMGAIRPAGQTSPQKPDDPASKRARIEGVSTKLQVPANILMALDEAGESDIEGIAAQLSAATKAGRKIEDIIPPELMNRAYDIADQMYPRQAAPATAPKAKEAGFVENFARQTGGALVRGMGGAVEALGIAAEDVATGGRGIPADQSETWARQGARWLGDHIRAGGQGIQAGVSDGAKAAIKASTPDGDLLDPSTWTFGENPSLEGYALLGADVLGSFLPVVATSIITKSPSAAAGVGGAMGGGAAAEEARRTVEKAAQTKLPDGRSALEANSPFYRELIASGMPEEMAVERTTRAAERIAGLMTAPISAFGGAATAKILTQPSKAIASRGLGVRVGGTAALSAAEEGVQEAAESIATKTGIQTATGMEQDLTEGTFGDFILGAIGGAVPGAAVGAFTPRQEELPNPGADGSGAGQITPPDMAPPGVAGGVIDNPPLPPAGPIERAAAAAPDLTPLPEVEPVEPPPMFPDQKPGAMVRLMDPETGEIFEGVFQREEDGNAIIRVDGKEVDIEPQFFDEMLAGARQADLEAEAAAKGGKGAKKAAVKPAPKPQPSEQPAPPVVPGVDDAAAEALREQGFYDGDWNAPVEGGLADQAQQAVKPPAEKRDPLDGISAEEAAKRLTAVEERIRKANKPGKKLTDLRDRLKGIVGDAATEGANEPNPQSPGASGIEPAGANQPDQPAGGRGAAQPSLEGGISEPGGAAVPGDVETGVDAGAKPEPKPALSEKPRAPVAPITTAPDDRIQPDMLGGAPTTETEMAAKERRRKEWGRVLGIADNRSESEETLEGRDVLIRPKKIVIRAEPGKASDLDFTIDIEGMSRDEIATALRGGLQTLDRIAPKPKAAPAARDGQNTSEIRQNSSLPAKSDTSKSDGFGVKWSYRKGDAIDVIFPATGEIVTGIANADSFNSQTQGPSVQFYDGGRGSVNIPLTRVRPMRPSSGTAVPTPAQIKAAAAKADKKPTDGQKEAGNYQMGHIKWNGLDITLETAKGTMRRGKDKDGEEWSVKMPAHYGYIKRTTGADGDHLDIYMGPVPDADVVLVIDQVDAETGRFDEHKVMLGFATQKEAEAAYLAGFSDGKGKARMGAATAMTVERFKENLSKSRWDGPWSRDLIERLRAKGEKAFSDDKPEPEQELPMPKGFTLGSVVKMNEAMAARSAGDPEANSGNWVKGDFKAVISRQEPSYSVFGGYGKTRVEAINDAIRRAQKKTADTAAAPAQEPDLGTEEGVSAIWERMGDPESREAQAAIKTLKKGDMVKVGNIGITMNKEGKEYVLRFYNRSIADGQPNHQRVVGDKKQGDVIEAAYRLFRGLANDRLRDAAIKFTTRPADRKTLEVSGYDYDQSAIEDHLNAGGVVTVGPQMVYVEAHVPSRGYMNMAVSHRRPDGITMQKTAIDFARDGGVVAMPRVDDYHEAVKDALREAKIPKPEAMKSKYELAKDKAGVAWDAMTPAMRKTWLVGKGRDAALAEKWSKDGWADQPISITSPFMEDFEGGKFETPPAPISDFSSIFDELVDENFGPEEPAADPPPAPAPEPAPQPRTAAPTGPRVFINRVGRDGLTDAERGGPLAPTDVPETQPRTASEAAASAAANIGGSMSDIASGLNALFGGGDKTRLNAGPTFDAETYAKAKPFFVAALRKLGQATTDIREMVGTMIRELMGAGLTRDAVVEMKPYVGRFIEDVEAGKIDPWSEAGESPASQNTEDRGNVEEQPAPEASDEQRPDQASDQGEPSNEGAQEAMDGEGQPDREQADDGRREGNENDAGEPSGADESGGLGSDPGSISDGPVDSRRGTPPPNFVITDDFALGEGTEGEKLAANMAALRLVRVLEAENRYATPDEQAILARWVGWGGLKTVFDGKHKGTTSQWGRAQAELRELLSATEYAAAVRSTNDAHYTPRTVVKAMWRAMRNFGFDGGRALEPTIGSGNFLGLQPADLSANTEWFASELDPTTGLIAKHLYPQAQVFDATGFQDAPFRRATFDIAIGNPPFGSDKIKNKKLHPDLGVMNVHNFIIAKTGQLLREGGVMGVVVTHRFLDAPNPEARAALAPTFRFVGAIRLPNTAFQANAGTEVTTDIVFFQKRKAGEPEGDQSWLQTDVDGPNGTKLNGYFAANPQMILGRAAMDGTMYAGGRKPDGKGEFTVHADGRDLGAALNEAIDSLEAAIPTREEALEAATTESENSSTLPYGAMMMTKDGRIYRGDEDAAGGRVVQEVTPETFWKDNAEAQSTFVQAFRAAIDTNNSPDMAARLDAQQRARDAAVEIGLIDLAGDPIKHKTKYEQAMADSISNLLFATKPRKESLDALAAYEKAVERKRLGSDGFAQLQAVLNLRQKTRELIAMERADAPEAKLDAKRRALRRSYLQFKKAYGFINNSKNEAILRGDVGPEFALEIHYKAANNEGRAESAKEAPILSQRVIFPHKTPDRVDTVEDGLHVSMQERGFVDPTLIASLAGKSVSDVVAEMVGGESPMAFLNPQTGHYEMSEVYLSGNLAEKIKAAQSAGVYQNIPHLEKAKPPPKSQEQIIPSIRSMWIPPKVFTDFLKAMGYVRPNVDLMEAVGMVDVDTGVSDGFTDFGQQFATERMSPGSIFEHAIKGKIPVVYDTIRNENGDKRQVKNEEATREAIVAYERMSREFQQWAYSNPQRAGEIVDAFNEKMNVVTERTYQGVRYLRMVGNSPEIDLRNSQKNGAWRMIQDKVTLLHHVVGAGKTFTGVVGVMERKRMGLTRKAVVAVPNHLTGQWGREWLELYPAANILVPTEKDFEPANRAKLINRIATGDFDAVIIGHSQLTKIENDAEAMEQYIAKQIEELEEALQQQRQSGESRRTIGQIGKRLTKLNEKLSGLREKLAEKSDSRVLGWKDLGVDYLMVDEAHLFKNLEYNTTATQLVGMNPPGGSQRAFDMLMKVRAIQSMKSGGVAFLTGTPVSNSLVEIYSMMKYLIPEQLESMNIQSFDGWKAAFIQDKSRIEYTASMQLKERNVMSGMINLGPLSQVYRSFADIVMRADVERMFTEQMEARNAAEPDPAKHVPTRFPTPLVKGGARRISLAPPTEKMKEFVRYLVMRMAGIKANKSNRAYPSIDNPLWVLTDARKASVDIRTIDPTLGREEGSKVDRSSAEVFRIWKENAARKGTQMVFCDMSAPSKNAVKDANRIIKEAYEKIGLKKADLKARIEADSGKTYAERWSGIIEEIEEIVSSPDTDERKRDALNEFVEGEGAQDAAASMFTADNGFSFYDDMKALLIEKGIPEKEIAFIHDYGTTIQKAQLFDAVNEGNIRVLIGSTPKMGAGTNAQRRLVALHHIDAPWRPSDMEQREGRIIRQGNLFYEQDPEGFEVEIIAYSTEQTADVVQWQVLERKAASIETFIDAATDSIVEEGGDADQYAEFMAQSTGKPVFLQKMQAEKERDTARAMVASSVRALSEADRFIRDHDRDLKLYRDRQATFESFTPDMAGEGSDTYLAEWTSAVAVYRAEKERVEAEANEIRAANENLPASERRKLPEMPKAPNRWDFPPKNAYERKIYDALSALQEDSGTRAREISLGGGFKIQIQARPSGTAKQVSYSAYLVPPGNNDLQYVNLFYGAFDTADAIDFRRSDKLLQAFSPANLAMKAAERADRARNSAERQLETLPQMQAIKDKGVDLSAVDEAEAKLARLSAMVRIEEVKFAAESAALGSNYFAEIDSGGRDLQADKTAQPLTGDFKFTNAGREYVSSFGAPNGTRRIEGTDRTGAIVIFEANDRATGEAVIIEAQKTTDPKAGSPETWSVLNVWEANDGSATMEMREGRAPVATLRGDELGAWEDMRQLARKAEAWYRDNLVGASVVNQSSGMEISFTKAAAKKLSGRKGDVLYRAVPALRAILEKGEVVTVTPETKGRKHIKAWHAVSATVMLEGKPRDVIAHVMETADGNFHYDLSRDMGDGARFMREGAETSITDNRYGLEDNPADLNLEFSPAGIKSPAGWGEVEADPPITEDDIRGITREMNAELARTGLAGKINVRVTRDLIGKSGRQIQGMFGFSAATGRPGIQVRAGAPAGERGVMRHEIIHALRSEKLWNKPFGLFTGAEWRELARAARAEPEIVATVMERYPEASREMQTEEMVAELYRLWAAQRDTYGGVERTLAKIEAFLQAMANLLRGKGFVSAALTMERIAGGRIGGRGPQGPGGGRQGGKKNSPPGEGAEMRAPPGAVRDKFKGLVGFRNWRSPSEWARNTMTDAVTSGKMSLLGLVPGRALFAELGKNIMSAKRYLRAKEEMDALRNEWHAKAAETAQKWMEMQKKDPAANDAMMDLMHRSTLSGVDPSQPDTWGLNNNLLKSAKEEISKRGDAAPDWAKSMLDHEKKRKTTYATVKQMYDALPEAYQAFYVEVKNAYEALANDFDKALEDNIKNASRIALKRAEKEHRKEMRRIKDEGLTGVERDEAVDAADKALAKVKKRAQMGVNTRIKSLRKTFESQRLKGPYFPLARFGDYFVTVRDENGRVTNFSRFETERAQQAFVREQEADNPGRVTFGLMADKGLLRDQVDPKFVADIEMMLADTGASPELMDSIWQRYLETMPDQSIRTSKIHRKGREGFNRDALRSFTSHTFHGAHQLARLKYGIELQDAMEDAMDEARRSDDPNRATALVNEMNRRMDWTMNPTGAAWSAGASSLAFVWYLGVSPAAALVNISQTTILGPALMKAAFRKASIGKITGELARAAKDFSQGRGTALGDLWSAENAPGLNDNERAALAEGYRRGTIDKTQAHDLAAVAESGVEFNPRREKWMRRIGFFFHHAERFNREVAFLANYRLAREDGMSHDDAIEKAADMTWKIHFSYQNSDRPRFMQDDIPKVIFIFRQFSTNMLYRLFRDTHQALKGATAADRAEAKTQLIGITLSMLAHAGVRGVWGYSLLMGLLSIFFPGDSDDLEDFIHDALLMEGDGLDVAAWNYAMGAVLNGVPGQITGVALTERIGMPDLWFRSPNRDLEGQDAFHYWLTQIAGPIGGIGSSLFMAAQSFGDAAERGDASMAVRGIEQAVPKFVRDIIRAGRYTAEGVQTRNGDALIESVSPIDVIVQANGFTPAKVSERYRVNNLLKNREKRVLDQRKALHRSAGDAIREGKAIPPRIIERIRAFNREFPEYPITSDTIRQSVQGRIRASNRNEFGISLNPKLNDRLRREVAPTIYN